MSDTIYYNLPNNISPGVVAIVLSRLFGATIEGYSDKNIQYDENGFVKFQNNKVSVIKNFVSKEENEDLDTGLDLTEYHKIFDSEDEMFYSEYDESKIVLFSPGLSQKEIEQRIDMLNGNVYQGSDSMQYMFSVYVSSLYDNYYSWPEDEYSYPSKVKISIGKSSANIAAFKHVTDILGGYILFSENYNGKEDIYLPETKYGLINCEKDRTEDEFKADLNKLLINAPFITEDNITWANKRLKEHGSSIDIKDELNIKSLVYSYQFFREREEMFKILNESNSLLEVKLRKEKPRKW